LVRRAADVLSRRHPGWSRLLTRELESIEGDLEALIWAIGCVWAVDVEGFIRRTRPMLMISLLMAGLYVTVHWLVTHLAWYGLPRPPLESLSGPPRGLLKIAVFLVLIMLIGAVTPGRRRRRVFAAAAFPLLALLALPATALGVQIVTALDLPRAHPAIAMIVSGPVFGFVVAVLLSLPFVLLYRSSAVPIAMLALLPPIAKTIWNVDLQAWSTHPYRTFLIQIWPFACSLLLIVMFTRVCDRWLRRVPGSSVKPQPG